MAELEWMQLSLHFLGDKIRVILLTRSPRYDFEVLSRPDQEIFHKLPEADVYGHFLELKLAIDTRDFFLEECGKQQAVLETNNQRFFRHRGFSREFSG